MLKRLTVIAAPAALAAAAVLVAAPAHATAGVNDPSCRPTTVHPYPVVFLHGLGANMNEDINVLQSDVAGKGYCTFALTYGTYQYGPYVGGMADVTQSAQQIAGFISAVLGETGASKVDIVGHSEGGFESLYTTKTQGIATKVDKVVAIAAPAHGTQFLGLQSLALALGIQSYSNSIIAAGGCPACTQLSDGGSAVATLDNGPIAQPGVSYTMITSRYDELVTPTGTSFVNEPGVTNEYVQDLCPSDPVGHIGEAYDTNVWNMVENALDPAHAVTFTCSAGSPG
ncbi:MAG TPA: alpha/beta fold hydrolase [Nocardioides sp.]|nr:alpha/beta fold hydrolase [Nocardioides sp.]